MKNCTPHAIPPATMPEANGLLALTRMSRNEMTVRALATAGELVEISGSGYISEGDFTVKGARLASSSPDTPAGNPR